MVLVSNVQLKCATVVISSKTVSEYDGNTKRTAIPVNEIDKITLKHGSPVERPIGSLFVSFLLLGSGSLLGQQPLSSLFLQGDFPDFNLGLGAFVLALPLIYLGVWYFIRFFQRKFYLSVETGDQKRKIVFETPVQLGEIQSFIERVQSDLNIKIDSALDPMAVPESGQRILR